MFVLLFRKCVPVVHSFYRTLLLGYTGSRMNSFHILTFCFLRFHFNPLTPHEHYSGRTTPLTFKHCILYIYSTNTDTEYFKHGIYSPFFSLHNAVCFIILTYLVPVLFTFYIQCAKISKNNSGTKRLMFSSCLCVVFRSLLLEVLQFKFCMLSLFLHSVVFVA